MYFHLILTDNCNLCCTYCRAKAFEDLTESEGERALVIDEGLPVDLSSISVPSMHSWQRIPVSR